MEILSKKNNYNKYLLNSKRQYYIHRSQEKFGSSSLESTLKATKDNLYNTMKRRYLTNFYNTVKPSNADGLKFLNDAMNEDKIMSELNNKLVNELNNMVNPSVVNKMKDGMLESFNSIEQIFKSSNTKDKIDALGTYFEGIRKAVSLIESSSTSSEVSLLVALKTTLDSSKGVTENIEKVTQAVNKAMENLKNKPLTINRKIILSIGKHLNNLGASYESGKKSFTSSTTNIFSKELGEGLISLMLGRAKSESIKEVSKTVQTLFGKQGVTIKEILDPETKKIAQKYGQRGTQVFKTDNSFKNISFSIESQENNYGGNFKIDLGVSTKWYKNLFGKTKILSDNITLTNETTGGYITRVKQLIGNNHSNLQQIYNAIAHHDDKILKPLNTSLLVRNLDVIISGLGSNIGDFSQVIYINNRFISVWDIILEAANYAGERSSTDKNSALTMSLGKKYVEVNKEFDMPQWQGKNSIYKAYLRSKKQNELIEQMDFKIQFNMTKLSTLSKTSFNY